MENNKDKCVEQDKFILLQNIGKFKKGKTFDSFGGLVSGVVVDLGDCEKDIKNYKGEISNVFKEIE